MENLKEFNALISLLEDPDPEVYAHVFEKLRSYGSEIIPSLENAWEDCLDPNLQKRIEELIHRIQFEHIESDFIEWLEADEVDLLKGALIINRFQYPDLDEQEVLSIIEKIKTDIWIEINPDLTALEKVKVFNHIFYNVHRFSGNSVNHLDPQNCFLNIVLESRKGNSISLGILYLCIAEMLDLPIKGVNLPFHFILAYIQDDKALSLFEEQTKENILFYINPFNRGAIFTEKEILTYLNKINPKITEEEIKPEFFFPCNKLKIIQVLITHLRNAFDQVGHEGKTKELNLLLEYIEQSKGNS